MATTGSPTARRRELGSMLRALRAERDLGTDEVAERLGFSRSKLSRLENGRRGANSADIARLCDLYQVDEAERRRLAELAAGGKERVWWQRLDLTYGDYVGLEAEAASISDYGLALVPGLLQTAEYARGVMRAHSPDLPIETLEERVHARITRQQRLTSVSPPAFTAVLDESVLHRVVGNPSLMHAQLRRLLEVSRLPNVTIRVVPFEAGVVLSGVNKFIILKLATTGVPDVVYVEDLTDSRYLEDDDDIAAYRATFQRMLDISADPDASAAMILAKAITYQPRRL